MNTLPRVQTKKLRYNEHGLSTFVAIAALASIGIVLILVFLFAGGAPSVSTGSTANSSDSKTGQTDQISASTAISQPALIRIPEGYTAYANKNYKFSFAYPQPWGAFSDAGTTDSALFSAQSLTFNKYALGESYLSGQLTASVYAKDTFKLALHADGATVTAAKLGDTYGWKVVKAGSQDPTLKVGDSYDVKSAKNQSNTTIYDFSTIQYGILQGRWLFESGDNFVVISLPIITRANGDAPAANDLITYKIIGSNMTKTMRPTN